MQPKTLLSAGLRTLAKVQGGVLSRAQLLGHGITRSTIARMLADGILSRMIPGIYTVDGAGWQGRAWAGVLLGGERAILGLEAAGHLHGLIGDAPDELTVFTPGTHVARDGWVFVRSCRLGVGEPPRTSIEETVLDLCAQRDEEAVAALLSDALSGGFTSAKRLRGELAQRGRQRHRTLLRDVLGDVELGAHSALERRFLVNVERAHGLPEAVRQAHPGRGHRVDGWYHEYGVLAELDSKLHHKGGAAFRDIDRDNEHALVGLLTLRLGWGQVSGVNACRTARTLGRVLMSRGWEGPVQPCTHCRLSFY